ncbi:metal-dependent amidase/aminoacylase/carboxypeptidase [Piedraia hortae CBS 480.64]|uniref:Metal-dependent amidase/aminoacylase/carboxypeptidase n=1 Tax=Piedraia hortae CBS 480.64 TaxID=1314780 RepID=A0A6A7BY57_9PEZI|nr:metal-dependent amidase/aminoacylase/carboxypeptidase [Piedraia hortae CBS 480.64]
MGARSSGRMVETYRANLDPYQDVYKQIHANPELSHVEHETSDLIAKRLNEICKDFHICEKVGGTGVVAILRNGSGKTVLLRADIDALPIVERTGLPYASKKRMKDSEGIEKPVMHACGHDMHIACLLAATELLVSAKDTWSGTLILAFQPGEEKGTGAQAMVDDGMYSADKHMVPVPDVCFGGHVLANRAGTVGTRSGLIANSADSMRVTVHGRGGHASMPNHLIDPIVMASSIILKLQTIVSREVDPSDSAVVTVASIQAGDADNVVVDDAELAIDVRCTNAETRKKVNQSIKRIIDGECQASNAVKPPTYRVTRTFPLTINDQDTTTRLQETFAAHFGDEFSPNCARMPASEDFSNLATCNKVPYCFFIYGGVDQDLYDKAVKDEAISERISSNHSATFAPVIMPTLQRGSDSYAVAALTYLIKDS